MTKDEALKLALEALETSMYPQQKQLQAITAIKAALEAKDEPIATKNNDGVTLHLGWDDLPVGTKLYATPPQRTWVGLTNEEVWECYTSQGSVFYQAIEAKLKEKNA